VARMGDGRGAYSVLVGRAEEKISLRRPRSRWDDNIKMDFYKNWEGVGRTGWVLLRIGTGGGRL
jgi:hypothetical protein